MNAEPAPPIRIGVSSCLLGARVRWDGQHKKDAFLVDELARFVEWLPVCPELEVGMGVPRETVRLLRGPRGGTRLVGSDTGADWTARMNAFAEARVKKLPELCGYILKAKSPSCGMERVNLYPDDGGPRAMPTKEGVGLFAATLMRVRPNLPVEEEGRLNDARLRENFIERVFAYARLQALWRQPWKLGALVAFHTAEKMVLLAHHTEGYRALGRLVAEGKRRSPAALRDEYEALFMATLRKLATRGRHANVLQHMLGHLRGRLETRDRDELAGLIDEYRQGLLPLIVPVTLLRHHLGRVQVPTLAGQTYLAPHPKELMLRNRV